MQPQATTARAYKAIRVYPMSFEPRLSPEDVDGIVRALGCIVAIGAALLIAAWLS